MYQKYCDLRDARGLNDYQVANGSGVNQSTFTDWKNGRSKPGVEKLYKLAIYFDVPMEYFMDTKGKKED